MSLKTYYEEYWNKRLTENGGPPIRSYIPAFLKKYAAYGAILNCIPKNSTILDIGCGDGNVTQLYKEKGEVYGIDISQNALDSAKAKGIKTQLQDLNNLPLQFENNFFDTVVMTDVLEHIVDPFELLKEAQRILKPQGKLVITVPNFARLSNRLKMCWGDPVDILHWSKYGDAVEHLHWFTKPKITHTLKTLKFQKIKFVPTGLPYNFVFGLLKIPSLGAFLTVVCSKEDRLDK